MEITKQKVTSVIVDYRCDVCGKECNNEYATLWASWGYNSRKDAEDHCCHLCESCYDKVFDFISNTLGGKVDVDDHGDLWR
jgi:hypothetical protein